MIHNISHEPNLKGKDYIVGDIHGCYEQLRLELIRIKFDHTRDRLFSVGDLIDRGPRSFECLLLAKAPWFYPTMGNHELMMFSCLIDNDYQLEDAWYRNGGEWVTWLVEYEKTHIRTMRDLFPYTRTLNTGKYRIGISHAGPPTSDWNDVLNLSDDNLDHILWSRKIAHKDTQDFRCKNIDFTIHGHTPFEMVKTVGNCIFIDTGSYHHENIPESCPGVIVHDINQLIDSLAD